MGLGIAQEPGVPIQCQSDRYGTSIGLVAALLVSVSPLHLEYAQVARYTATLTFAITLTLCSLAWLMGNPQRACTPRFGFAYDPSRNTANKIDLSASMAWLGLTLGTALSLWLHNLSPLFVASITLVIIVWWVWGLRRNQAFLFNALIAGGVAFLLWLPFLPTLWETLGYVSKQFWIAEPSFLDVAHVFDIWFGVNYLHFWSFFPLAAAAFFGLWVIWREAGLPLVILLVGAIVIPIAMMFTSTYVFRPMWFHRPLYWVSVPYYVLVAAGTCQLRQRWVRVSATVFLAVILAAGTVNYYQYHRQQPWNEVVDNVLQGSGPNSLVLLLSNTIEVPFSHYAKRKGLEARIVGLPLPFPAINVPDHPNPGDAGSGPGTLIAVILAAGTVNYYQYHRQQPWNEVVDNVLQGSGPNSLVLLLSNTIEVPFSHYAKRKGLEARIVGLPLPFPAINVPDHPYPGDAGSGPGMMESDLPKLRSELASRSPVWLVTQHYELYDPRGLIRKVLTETRGLVEEKHYLDGLSVYRFDWK